MKHLDEIYEEMKKEAREFAKFEIMHKNFWDESDIQTDYFS